jgi:hypothetical protein
MNSEVSVQIGHYLFLSNSSLFTIHTYHNVCLHAAELHTTQSQFIDLPARGGGGTRNSCKVFDSEIGDLGVKWHNFLKIILEEQVVKMRTGFK